VVTISGNFGFAHTLERHCQRAYTAIRLTLIAAIDVPGVARESRRLTALVAHGKTQTFYLV